MRTGSAISQQAAIDRLASRQNEIGRLQEQISSGRSLQRVSDDPGAAARAERARTALSRIDADQRGLQGQRNAMQLAESALGRSVDLLQRARELMLQAQNGTLGTSDRSSIAAELAGLRDQLVAAANQRDANGIALFGGLAAGGDAFVSDATGVRFAGEAGQALPDSSSVPGSLDGSRVWMNFGGGNGVFEVAPDPLKPGSAWLGPGEVSDPSKLTGHNYEVVFSVVGGVTTYSVNDLTNSPSTSVLANQPMASSGSTTIEFDGMRLQTFGVPADGQRFTVAPSTRTDLFSVIDRAVSALRDTSATPALRAGSLARSQRELDQGMDRVMLARTMTGDWLTRADAIESQQQTTATGVEQLRAQAEDTDLMQTVSQMQNESSTLDIALKSYAQIQRISLFNYLSS